MKDNVTEYATVSIAPDVVGSEHADNSSILLGKEGSDMARLTLRSTRWLPAFDAKKSDNFFMAAFAMSTLEKAFEGISITEPDDRGFVIVVLFIRCHLCMCSCARARAHARAIARGN